ncbi:MAG: PIN domain-containing protein [Oscillospiraceae bacterium]|nr:PIN domain-containing protein [Oscillospiraceae bacterium]
MKILIDTNVILDVLCSRPEFLEASSRVWKYCEVGQIEGYISALSVPNIVYILRKELTPLKTVQIIQQITMIFKVVDLRSADLKAAAKLLTSDYEDALQMCQAGRIGAEYIVTRNIRDFKDSKVPALKPSELLERI